MLTQDEMKQATARAAIEYVPAGIIGVGTGSTANFFIDALADIKRVARKENHRMVVKRGLVARDNRAAFSQDTARVAAE